MLPLLLLTSFSSPSSSSSSFSSFLSCSSGFFGAELVSNFYDLFLFPFLALVAFSLCYPLFPSHSLLVPSCHETRLNPAVRAICSCTYLYFIIAEVFTLCPPLLVFPAPLLSPLSFSLSRSRSYLLSCLLYDIYSDAKLRQERLLLQYYEAKERGGKR